MKEENQEKKSYASLEPFNLSLKQNLTVDDYSLSSSVTVCWHDDGKWFKFFFVFQHRWCIYGHVTESYSGSTLFTCYESPHKITDPVLTIFN